MDKIRLGNDIEMRWSIFTRDGDNKVPYNLEGRALTLSVVNRTGESEIEFFAEGNIVTGVFRGRDQRILGKHGVILRENNGKDGMRTIDACDAFELVACTCEEALGSSGTIQLFHLTFDSTIGAITGTIDPILNYEAEQAEAERKANEIIRKANEQQRIDNEKQRNVNEILRNIAEEERKNAEQERIVNEDLRKADETERKTNEESRLQSESERVSSEEERLYAESIRVANENARIASEAKRAEAETARIEAEDKRIVSEKNRLSAESSRIANEDSRRANEDSRLSAEAKRVSAEEERVSAELERQAKFASMVVQTTGDATDKVMSQKSVTEALKGKQNKLTAGEGISIDGDVISATLDMDIVRVVDALPSVGEANLIYLVPAEQPSENDLFEEWVWTDKWERIGSAKMDLSNYATKTELATKANIQHQHTVADITDFPELYYDATAFFASGAYPSDKYGELLEAVKAKKTVYATLDEEGYVSYIFFMSSANNYNSSSRVLLTTIFVDGSFLYTNTFVLQQSGMTSLQESITGKANKATTLAGYGIGDAYTKSELDALLNGKQPILTDTDGSYGQRVANLETEGIASQEKLTELEKEIPLKDTKEDGFAICNEKGEAIARYVGDKWKLGVIESESIDEAKSIATIEEDGFAICNEKGEAIARYVGDKWVLSGSAIGKSQNGVVSVSHLDMTANSKVILLGSNSVQNHKSMAFSGIINGTFNGISLGHGYKGYFLASWIDVTSTDIVVHNFTSTEAIYTYPHGLTIENNIQVIISIGYKDKKIKVVSNGISFEQDLANKYMGAALDVWVKSSSELIDCSMSWACPKLQNGVWIFGDSFYTLGDNKRWVTHLFNDGFVNSIVVARSGETDFGGLTSLNTLLKVATPRCIVWGLGMNDHDISATEYNVNWKNVIDRVIAICKENGIDLILATIPSAKQDTSTEGAAPNDAIHEAKNTYIRTSGMKYIDFAKAVGATSEGIWFNGMKEDTGVHPTEKGARALYMQAVADAPEILI